MVFVSPKNLTVKVSKFSDPVMSLYFGSTVVCRCGGILMSTLWASCFAFLETEVAGS